ncbi:TBC1 domain family member 31 isoform X2 [Vidua macroura]|uniref:TBC1 domain family member 31 isoform X2 n=1 Tax=Vidua macroura TaxID=187451 RepID=UPI0023A8CD86|nr:TBC1 domain family member 31 isoform X2 [Vidua macroura]
MRAQPLPLPGHGGGPEPDVAPPNSAEPPPLLPAPPRQPGVPPRGRNGDRAGAGGRRGCRVSQRSLPREALVMRGQQERAGNKSCACDSQKSHVLSDLLHCVINTLACEDATFLLHCPALAALLSPVLTQVAARRPRGKLQLPAAREAAGGAVPFPDMWGGERSPPFRLFPIGEAGAGCTTRAAPPGAERGRSPEGSAGAAAPGGDGALRSGRAAARAHLDPQGGGGRTAGNRCGWKGPLEIIQSSPAAKAGSPRAAYIGVQVGLECLQRGTLHDLRGHPVWCPAILSLKFCLLLRVIVNIIHSVQGYHSKTIHFLNVAFDSSGDSLLAGDRQGNIYVFDLNANRFNLVQRTMQACTALAFNLRRKTEFLVALADYSVKCFDTETQELVSWMRGHESSVSSISVHGSGKYAITTSTDTAQLWDLDTFQRIRKLNVRQSVGIQKVFFLPLSNTILSCFKDNSVFAWEFDTLHCKYQLSAPVEGSVLFYKVFAVTRDGHTLVAGGKSNHLHVWCLELKRLMRIIQMPEKVRAVRHLEFLPDSFDGGSNQVLGVLSQDNIMRFINIETCKLLFDIGSPEEGISTAVISPNGQYIASVMENGSLNLYSVQALTQEGNKPPPFMFKVVEDGPKYTSETNKLITKVTSGRSKGPWKSKQSKIQSKLLKLQANTSLENKENELPGGLSKKRLQALLKGFGEYPAKYRMFVWRSLLQLPENHLAFSSLIDRGIHSAFVNIQKEYPIKSGKLLRVLQRTLSALAHWSAIFAETPYMPLLAFPFVKLFQNNQLICFEVVATVVVNFCQHWFEYFPNPPVNILGMMENVLAYHDKELLQHLIKYNVTSQVYAWPLLETLLSEVLTREEWLKTFDNIFSNHPSYFLMIVIAYVICSRAPLLHCNQAADFEYFFHHRNNVDINVVIKEAYHLMEATPLDIHPQHMLDDFTPLTKGQYPVFNKYPVFIVNYQAQKWEKIRQDEIEYLRERQLAHESEAIAQEQKAEDEAWYQKQKLLQEAEEQRQKILLEEEKLAEQRQRLAVVKRELKIKELQLLDASRRRFLNYQQDQLQMELKRLNDEIARKHLIKDQEAVTKEIKEELEAHRRKVDLEDQRVQRLIETDKEEIQKAHSVAEENLAKAEQKHTDSDWRLQRQRRLRRADQDREKRYREIVKLLHDNRVKEAELLKAMRETEEEKEDVVQNKAQLEEEQKAAAAVDGHRKQFLDDKMNDELELAEKLQREDGHFERLHNLKARCPERGVDVHQVPRSGNICLNDLCTLASSPQNRRRAELARQERELMAEVRQLRRRLASQAKGRHPPARFPATTWSP